MTNSKKKIEIYNVDLDINLDNEIKKHATLDTDTKDRIASIINIARERAKKPIDPEELIWNEKFEKLFVIITNNPYLAATKQITMDILSISAPDLGKIIAKFKKFLRVNKDNKWSLIIGQDNKNERIYSLKRSI
jgi:hypothetical protein